MSSVVVVLLMLPRGSFDFGHYINDPGQARRLLQSGMGRIDMASPLDSRARSTHFAVSNDVDKDQQWELIVGMQ